MLAGALNLLMTGNAFIYYGEALGMKGSGKDENKGAPMQWSSTDLTGMCNGPADMDKFDMKYPALDEQAADEYSIFNYYKAAIKLRNMFPVIARGKTVVVDSLSDGDISAFVREKKEESTYETDVERLLILINTSDESKEVDISTDDMSKDYGNIVYSLCTSEEKCEYNGGKVVIPAYGIAVLAAGN